MDSLFAMSDPSSTSSLGVPGYSFSDLHEPERLASLYERFCEGVAAADPALWREWDAYRAAPDAPRAPVGLSHLLVAMASHVSRFVTRLFSVGAQTNVVADATRAEDDLFRFKVDFVRRRVLPLLKGAGRIVVSADDDALVEHLTQGASLNERELAIARAGCALMDREKAALASASAQQGGGIPARPDKGDPALGLEIEALKRWCAARVHDPAYRSWVVFRFPENIDYWRLVEVQHPRESPDGAPREVMLIGPDRRLRRRDGF